MRQIVLLLSLCATICISGCAAKPAPILVTPKLEIPARPQMLPVNWIDDDKAELHCLTDDCMKNLIINNRRQNTHIEILEGHIRAIGGAR